MFKNRGLGAKIGMGFGVLILLVAVLGVFNWRGSTRVEKMVDVVRRGQQMSGTYKQVRRPAPGFPGQGLCKAAGEEKTSADKWRDSYNELISNLDTLKKSSAISDLSGSWSKQLSGNGGVQDGV